MVKALASTAGTGLNLSTGWYGTLLARHDGTLEHTGIKIFMLEKRLLFKNSVNQILLKQLKLYSVMCYFIITCMLSPNFKGCVGLFFYGF